jgi:extracellular matrix protein 14
MYPYSFSCSEVPPDAENLFEALLRASKAIRNVHKQNYDVGGVCDVSYTATGQSLDWTYKTLGAKWSFAANLRDQGVYAFMLPPDQIVPTGQEMLAGLLDMAKFIAQKEKIEE